MFLRSAVLLKNLIGLKGCIITFALASLHEHQPGHVTVERSRTPGVLYALSLLPMGSWRDHLFRMLAVKTHVTYSTLHEYFLLLTMLCLCNVRW